MSYFNKFNIVDYQSGGRTYNVKNITQRVAIDGSSLDDVSFYAKYTIPNGWRPDNVSQDLYGTPEYYWTFFLINEHLNNAWTDWPMHEVALLKYLKSKYRGVGVVNAIDSSVTGVRTWGTNTMHDKFRRGDIVTSIGSPNKHATVLGVFPTLGYIQILPDEGVTFTAGDILNNTSGSGILGDTFERGGSTIYIGDVKPTYDMPHHFNDWDDDSSYGYGAVSNMEYERDVLISNSDIRIIKPEHIQTFADAYNKELQSKG
jgi:hypothetical protein